MQRILIVDDEASIRRTLTAFAQREGYEASSAADVEQALALLHTSAFDVVLTDILLPKKSGIDLLRQIRESWPALQVVVITGAPTIDSASEAVRQGAMDYLVKPIDRPQFLRVAKAAFAQKHMIDVNRALEEENRKHREELEALVDEQTRDIRKREEMFRLLAENSLDVIWQMDLRLRFTYISPSIRDLTGHSVEEWEGSNLRDHASRKEFRKMAREAIRSIKSFRASPRVQFDTAILRKDGSEIAVEITGRLVLGKNGTPVGFQGTTRDVTARKEADARVHRLHTGQQVINRLGLEIGTTSDPDEIYGLIYETARNLVGADWFIVSAFDPSRSEIMARYVVGDGQVVDASSFPPIPLGTNRGTQSRVIISGEGLRISDYRSWVAGCQTAHVVSTAGAMIEPGEEDELEDVIRSALLVPMRFSGQIIGVMQAQSYRENDYTEEDEDLMISLANMAAVGLENAFLMRQAREALEGTIQALSNTMESRDPYTASHQRRASTLATAIAHKMGLDDHAIEGLRVAALLHDIGKIGIPSDILSKPSSLSEAELSLIQTHPAHSKSMLEGINFPWPVAEIALQHHERLDGSGYPRGLTGDKISVEAKILAVADVVEAMASHRPHRAAHEIPAILHEIREGRGRLYDPNVVDSCVALLETGFPLDTES